MKHLLIVVFIISSSFAFAGKKALIMGGSCENDQKDRDYNLFQKEIPLVSKALSKRGWDVQAFYAGDEARCSDSGTPKKCPEGKKSKKWSVEPLIKQSGLDPANVKMNTKEDIFAALEAEILDAERAKASGEENHQVFLGINTHGGPATSYSGHTICLSNKDGTGDILLYVSDLRPYLERLKKAGAKVALHDSSCYSGGSVKELGDLGCVMSTQSSNRVGYSSFDEGSSTEGALRNLLESGKTFNLEDVFLKGTLNESFDTSNTVYLQPSISGFYEGNESGDQLLGILSPPKDDYVTGKAMEDKDKNRCDQVLKGLDELKMFSTGVLGQLQDDWMRKRVEQAKGSRVKAPQDLLKEIDKQVEEYKKLFTVYMELQDSEKTLLAEMDKIYVDYDVTKDIESCPDEDCNKYWKNLVDGDVFKSPEKANHLRIRGNELRHFVESKREKILPELSTKETEKYGEKFLDVVSSGLKEDKEKYKSYKELRYKLSKIEARKEASIERNEFDKGSRNSFFDSLQNLKAKLNKNIATARAYAFVAGRSNNQLPSDCADFQF